MFAPTQLVATLGPASLSLARALAAAGATAFRLNASHLDAAALRDALATIRRLAPQSEIVVDLQGAKMRLGLFAARPVAAGERLVFALDGHTGLALPHREFFVQAQPGDTISVDDGRLRFRVAACADERLDAVALNAGLLQPRKGVNVLEHPIALAGLTCADRDALDAVRGFDVRRFAFSFMQDGREARWLREVDAGCRVVGKIERREAIERLDAVARAVDEIWICRGDLGAQLGEAALARFVAGLEPPSLPVPVLMAGQVLEHLTQHADPTRSEVCHLFDLVARGYAGIVLSDETAIGADPVRAVSTARSLLDGFDDPSRARLG